MSNLREKLRAIRARWEGCRLCPGTCDHTKVFGRGQYEPDLLFVGMAPGEVEDLEGLTFVGPSGRKLDRALEEAERKAGRKVTKYFVNLLLCRTVDERGNNRDPSPVEIKNCSPRLVEMVRVLKPRRIVHLGRLATTWAPSFRGIPESDVWHPAYVVRDPRKFDEYVNQLVRVIQEVTR